MLRSRRPGTWRCWSGRVRVRGHHGHGRSRGDPRAGTRGVPRGERPLGAGLLLGGTSAYVLAKAAKRYVGRGRPATELEDVTIRGKEEGDLGFPSGHAAVSAAMTTAAAPFVPPPVRLLAVGLAGFVSFALVHVGAHLPLDVIGSACMGVAVGSAVNLALGASDDRLQRM